MCGMKLEISQGKNTATTRSEGRRIIMRITGTTRNQNLTLNHLDLLPHRHNCHCHILTSRVLLRHSISRSDNTAVRLLSKCRISTSSSSSSMLFQLHSLLHRQFLPFHLQLNISNNSNIL